MFYACYIPVVGCSYPIPAKTLYYGCYLAFVYNHAAPVFYGFKKANFRPYNLPSCHINT